MGGKVWSVDEERVFWTEIVPSSNKRNLLTRPYAQDARAWNDLRHDMQQAMGDSARRKYTGLMLYEHYFQNSVLERFSPHAGKFVRRYIEQERKATGMAPSDRSRTNMRSQHRTRRARNSPGPEKDQSQAKNQGQSQNGVQTLGRTDFQLPNPREQLSPPQNGLLGASPVVDYGQTRSPLSLQPPLTPYSPPMFCESDYNQYSTGVMNQSYAQGQLSQQCSGQAMLPLGQQQRNQYQHQQLQQPIPQVQSQVQTQTDPLPSLQPFYLPPPAVQFGMQLGAQQQQQQQQQQTTQHTQMQDTQQTRYVEQTATSVHYEYPQQLKQSSPGNYPDAATALAAMAALADKEAGAVGGGTENAGGLWYS